MNDPRPAGWAVITSDGRGNLQCFGVFPDRHSADAFRQHWLSTNVDIILGMTVPYYEVNP
jgi:hypothetical protein